jgi:hypothetical protein
MSSVSAQIHAISNARPDSILTILASISDSMARAPLTPTEAEQLTAAITSKLPTAPSTVFDAFLNICRQLIEGGPSSLSSVLGLFRTQLTSPKKSIQDAFLSLSEHAIQLLTPDVFWDHMRVSFITPSVQLKECALILMKYSLDHYPDFTITKMIPSIFALLLDNSPPVQSAAFAVARVLHHRQPDTVGALLRKQFPAKSDEILMKLKGEQPQSHAPPSRQRARSSPNC